MCVLNGVTRARVASAFALLHSAPSIRTPTNLPLSPHCPLSSHHDQRLNLRRFPSEHAQASGHLLCALEAGLRCTRHNLDVPPFPPLLALYTRHLLVGRVEYTHELLSDTELACCNQLLDRLLKRLLLSCFPGVIRGAILKLESPRSDIRGVRLLEEPRNPH